MTEFADARKVAAMFAALAEPTRLRILFQLIRGPHNVGQLAGLVGTPMVNMSHHLGVMRDAGLLEDEKDGRKVVYRLRTDVFTPGPDGEALGTLTFGAFRLVVLLPAGLPAAKTKRKPPGS
jgi:DNA-binding transcriptional ArsR family regulator